MCLVFENIWLVFFMTSLMFFRGCGSGVNSVAFPREKIPELTAICAVNICIRRLIFVSQAAGGRLKIVRQTEKFIAVAAFYQYGISRGGFFFNFFNHVVHGVECRECGVHLLKTFAHKPYFFEAGQ